MLNHSSRELLQIMAVAQTKLEDHERSSHEVEQLKNTLQVTWEALMQQINSVSNYLKGDEDVLRVYSETKVENSESTFVIQYNDNQNQNNLGSR